ncbi:isochorismatase family protein [Agrobacterium rubi TR3 = NBRC 13261]|uniref:Isochorismatase family protein n=1 Tax=Agrobacterium rubi TR3 = NBRC 13261 TaxID=1368415 RepID=A0A081D238_9HYPH|nr:isochorismatase family cysteine hydrolase [Agrobacterium rubi]MBP1881011.1 nicotinamidase-related amidase [Agrobacterium rubi]MCL6653748.1 isochorismatase [Agrobacterium rubi]GAK72984.1 isochorismatase family protein [Agrobacterium rubi TR3 = NBRC 13261]
MTDVQKTALVFVDVINSFFEPGHPNYYPAVEEVLGPMRKLREQARASGAITVHAVERHRPEFHDFEWKKLPIHHLEDAHDADFFKDFRPHGTNEIVVYKRRFSAFFATDLALFLTEQKVTRAIIAGVKTNVCIRASAQDAFANGFEPVIVREATNSNRPHLAEASLEDIERYMGRVVSLAEGLEMLT